MTDDHVQRRLAAILVTDVVGYSRLMGGDEAGTRSRYNAHLGELIEPSITNHQGRIVKSIGDGLLVEFASVVDAIQSATEIQKGMAERNSAEPDDRRIDLRIGVNLGDVIVEGNDIHGDGVNVAARLEALAEPGGVCVSRAARDQIRDKLGYGLEDLGEFEVKNIARPIRAFRVLPDQKKLNGAGTKPRELKKFRKAQLIVLFCFALTVILGVTWYHGDWDRRSLGWTGFDTSQPKLQQRPALIVLPFNNLSGDSNQDYFSDAFTEDLTTGLARIHGFLVVAKNTAFAYRTKAVDPRELGRKLGVRYVLEGSARRQDGRLRINAQLIETATGTHVWAERFDRPLEDIFIVQDKLVDRIVGSVAARLRRHEGERAMAASKATLAAYDLASRARILFRQNTVDTMTEARKLLYRATEIDPSYAPAFSLLAQVENFFFTSRVGKEYAHPDTAERVLKAASQATELSPEDAFARAVHGMSLRMAKDYDRAALEAQRARKLAPNDPEVLAPVAVVLLSVGDYKGSVETMNLAWLLDPHLSPVFTGVVLSQGLYALGDYQTSKNVALDCIAKTPGDVRCHESLVRALGELGPTEEVDRAVDKLLSLSPNYTVSE
ncbi:MAG: adenylate/guanylate cyclase domain-containing protein, partial [Hyphomicrobiaceae bacterium]